MTQWRSVLTLPVLEQRDHIRGPTDAPLTLVEYGDFECPFCGAAYPIVKQVLAVMAGQLRFVFRHFPMTTVHPRSELAAEAAEAAGAQGMFWEMHDMLFEHQDRLALPWLRSHAAALALDLDLFDRDLATRAHAARVREDFLSGVRSGVNGTPTFFINGVRYDGSWEFASLLAALSRAAA
jgi:protein-disulfide isomerase